VETLLTINAECPCGSGLVYTSCCGVYHDGSRYAQTAEALMRSRYSAFVLKLDAYVLATWDNTLRPKSVDFELDASQWQRLEIIACKKGLANDSKGIVEFNAYYLQNGQAHVLHETSRFVKRGNHWFYLDGKVKAMENSLQKTNLGLNALCSCGSGKKYKRCCG
jgi:SEC-C motif domain protein